MSKYEKIYQELRKKYSDEEIADSMLIPADLSREERAKANAELKAFRFKLLNNMNEEQRIYSDLLRFKYQVERYLRDSEFDKSKSFGKLLAEYAHVLRMSKKKLSEDLGIHYTRLSRIINDKENPNIQLAYRLEKHSGELISAISWWQLVSKKLEYEIKMDKVTRKKERSKVKSAVKFRA